MTTLASKFDCWHPSSCSPIYCCYFFQNPNQYFVNFSDDMELYWSQPQHPRSKILTSYCSQRFPGFLQLGMLTNRPNNSQDQCHKTVEQGVCLCWCEVNHHFKRAPIQKLLPYRQQSSTMCPHVCSLRTSHKIDVLGLDFQHPGQDSDRLYWHHELWAILLAVKPASPCSLEQTAMFELGNREVGSKVFCGHPCGRSIILGILLGLCFLLGWFFRWIIHHKNEVFWGSNRAVRGLECMVRNFELDLMKWQLTSWPITPRLLVNWYEKIIDHLF